MSVFIVAEAGVNWNGDRTKIVALIEAAKSAGASHVKFQAFNADALIKRRGITDQNTIDLLRRCELTDDDLDMIQREAGRVGIPHFYSVFDPSQVERVLSRGACALKIGHAEADYGELIQACARRRVPKYVSIHSVSVLSKLDRERWCFVWGTWEYPATSKPALDSIDPSAEFAIFTGYSSHYTDYRIPAAAALRGAEYIEFHIATEPGQPEAAWSLMPDDAKRCCELIRLYEQWL